MSVIAELIRTHQWTRGVELGVWQGATFGSLLASFPNLRLTGVDHWRAIGPYVGKDMVAAELMARSIEKRYQERAKLVKSDTVSAAALFAPHSCDFVFIDASHDTDSVCADIRAWRPKVRPGGMLLGHDANWISVQDALEQELGKWDVIEEGNVWIYLCT